MGDPRKQRSKFSGPSHPWNKARIDEEKELGREFGFRNKAEIWKMNSLLRNFRNQAKKIIALRTEQAEKEKELLLKKLKKLGILDEGATVESVLGLTLRDILERRLQSVVFRKGLARSMLQARQFIVHEHIKIGDKKITAPSYLVSVSEESMINYAGDSPLTNELHPERIQEEKVPKKPEAAEGESKEEKTEDASKKKAKKKVKKKSAKKEEKAEEKESAADVSAPEAPAQEAKEEKGEE